MSNQTTAIGSLSLCGSLCLLSALGAGAWAAEGDGTAFHDLMLGFAGAPTPDVTEDTKDSTGVTTTYEWQDPKSFGFQGSVTLLNGTIHEGGGIVWGGELVFADYDITPGSFLVNDVRFKNDSTASLSYQSLGINLVGGYQIGMTTDQSLHGFLEFLPVVGFGIARADNEVQNSGGKYIKENGNGTYYQYGLRIGAYLTERNWIYGVTASYLGGEGSVKMDFPGGFKSELTLEQSGVAFGGVAGYRF